MYCYTGAYKYIYFYVFIKWGQHPLIIYYYNLLHFALKFWIKGCLDFFFINSLLENKQTNK